MKRLGFGILTVGLLSTAAVASPRLAGGAQAASAPVAIPMPFNGKFGNASVAETDPAVHDAQSRRKLVDWSTDLYAPGGTRLSLSTLPAGAVVTYEYYSGSKCGDGIFLTIHVDGRVGQLFFGHLVLDPDLKTRKGGTFSSATREFGRLATFEEAQQWKGYGVRRSCYRVTNPSGVHTHLVAFGQDAANHSCFVARERGALLDAGTAIGELGPTGVTSARQACSAPPAAQGFRRDIIGTYGFGYIDIPPCPSGTSFGLVSPRNGAPVELSPTLTWGNGVMRYELATLVPGTYEFNVDCMAFDESGNPLVLSRIIDSVTMVRTKELAFVQDASLLRVSSLDPCPIPPGHTAKVQLAMVTEEGANVNNLVVVDVGADGHWTAELAIGGLPAGNYGMYLACEYFLGGQRVEEGDAYTAPGRLDQNYPVTLQ